MKRYLPSSRSRSNIHSNSAVGDQLIREFTAQARAVMLELSAQFATSLQSQASQILQEQLAARVGAGIGSSIDVGDDDSGEAASGDGDAKLFGGLGQLLNTGARYLFSRPRTSTSAVETTRSIDATAQFRVSGSQAAAEAQLALSKGSKNL